MARKEKLVRDLIPGQIETKGEACVWRKVVLKSEALKFLLAKFDEEKAEYCAALGLAKLNELADLDEVIFGHAFLHGISREEILALPTPRFLRMGGTHDAQRLFLLGAFDSKLEEYLSCPKEEIACALSEMHQLVVALAELEGFTRRSLLIEGDRKRALKGGFSEWLIMEIE